MKTIIKIVLVLSIMITSFLVGFYFVSGSSSLFDTEISTSNTQNINPTESIAIGFSVAPIPSKFGKPIEVFPKENIKITWENSNKRLIISPQKFWKPESEYRIILPEGRNMFFAKTAAKEINFSVVNYPRVKNFVPSPGAKDVSFDIEDPVTIDFNRSIEGFFVAFVIEPKIEIIYSINPEKTQFKILPKNENAIENGKEYKIKVAIKQKNDMDENYKQIYESSFETLPPAPQSWEKDFALRLEQAKKYTRPKIISGKYIDINLTIQIMTIFEEGNLLDSFLISSGKKGMETPKGEYAIRNKTPRAWSKVYGLYMPYWMALAPDGKFGIHELPEWPGGYKEGANHLGIPVSHGCVRLGIGPAKRVFEWADINTPVVVY
jgi:lipoprotein-anchoring transpeptidase ErfK/SrfK